MQIKLKQLFLGLVTVMIISAFLSQSIVHADFPLRVVVNGTKVGFPDAKPYLDKNNRVMVPVRFVSEALGAKVEWDGKASKVTVKQDEKTVILFIGKKEIDINGKKDQMDTVAVTNSQRTFVPLRFVSQALGASVTWDSAVRTAYINTNGEQTPKADTEVIGGLIVPKKSDTDLIIYEDTDINAHPGVWFEVNLLRDDVNKQIEDLAVILSQKCDQTTVDELVKYIKKKDERWGHLDEKFIYDNRSKRYIWVNETDYEGIDILYASEGLSKKWKKHDEG